MKRIVFPNDEKEEFVRISEVSQFSDKGTVFAMGHPKYTLVLCQIGSDQPGRTYMWITIGEDFNHWNDNTFSTITAAIDGLRKGSAEFTEYYWVEGMDFVKLFNA